MTDEVRKLIELSLQQPVRLAADRKAAAPSRLRQEVVRLKGGAANDKDAVLLALCSRVLRDKRTIVFCTHKWRAHKLRILLGLAQLPPAAELHGDMTQVRPVSMHQGRVWAATRAGGNVLGGAARDIAVRPATLPCVLRAARIPRCERHRRHMTTAALAQAARLEALEAFRRGDASILLATDVAARGLDILGVTTVINYDCPASVDAYLHRIGRTARAGADGLAISFAEDGDRKLLKLVVKQVGASLAARVLPDAVVAAWRTKAERLYPQVDDIVQVPPPRRPLHVALVLYPRVT